MANSRSAHQIEVNKVSFSSTFDTWVNIQKRRESVLYTTASTAEVVNLSYVQGQAINSDENLTIKDRSFVLPENNSRLIIVDQVVEDVKGFNIETDAFLVTDVFSSAISTQGTLPLFYQHNIQYELAAQEQFADIKILDSNFAQVVLGEVSIDSQNGIVYNNLVNSFDLTSGAYEVYYITYLVKDLFTGVLTRYTELLSNQTVYREATFEDLDEFGSIPSTAKVYILEEDITDTFNVVLPTINDYGIRRLDSNQLKLINPPSSDMDDPWFVSVNNNKFISSVETASGVNSILKYRVAEFNVQNFVPFLPYKFTTETSSRVTRRIVKTVQDKIRQDADESLYVDVRVNDSSGTGRFILTSDPSKVGTAAADGLTYANVLLGDSTVAGTNTNDGTSPIAGSSIDGLYGFIILPAGYEIEETDEIVSSYYYEEDKYQFAFLDLNPLSNKEILRERVVIFCKPEPLGTTLTQSLFYLVVNEDGVVIESNYNEDGTEGLLHDGVDIQTIMPESGLWYERDPRPDWHPTSGVDFITNYTVEGVPNEDAFLILGEVYSREVIGPEDLTFSDIRLRGGGINENNFTTAEEVQPEVTWNWDVGMWDGYPYPAAASYFVEIPSYTLEDCGGLFTPQTIRGIVNRHAGLGVYPVIHKYNDYEPTITDIEITVSGTYLTWTQHPDDAIFDIYIAQLEAGPWTQVASGLNNVASGNNTVLNIAEDQIRYILITGREGLDGPVCFSGPIDVVDPGLDVPPSL